VANAGINDASSSASTNEARTAWLSEHRESFRGQTQDASPITASEHEDECACLNSYGCESNEDCCMGLVCSTVLGSSQRVCAVRTPLEERSLLIDVCAAMHRCVKYFAALYTDQRRSRGGRTLL
jgi:hypothetical protein